MVDSRFLLYHNYFRNVKSGRSIEGGGIIGRRLIMAVHVFYTNSLCLV